MCSKYKRRKFSHFTTIALVSLTSLNKYARFKLIFLILKETVYESIHAYRQSVFHPENSWPETLWLQLLKTPGIFWWLSCCTLSITLGKVATCCLLSKENFHVQLSIKYNEIKIQHMQSRWYWMSIQKILLLFLSVFPLLVVLAVWTPALCWWLAWFKWGPWSEVS